MTLSLFIQAVTAIGILTVAPATMLLSRRLAKKDKEAEYAAIEATYAEIASAFQVDPNKFVPIRTGSKKHRHCEELFRQGRLVRVQLGMDTAYKLAPLIPRQ